MKLLTKHDLLTPTKEAHAAPHWCACLQEAKTGLPLHLVRAFPA